MFNVKNPLKSMSGLNGLNGAATRGRHRPMRPPLASGERVLAAEGDGEGGSVVATTLALYHQANGSPWSRLGWEETGRVSWDARRDLLDLTDLHLGRRLTLSLPRGLVALVRERIGSTRLASARVSVIDGVTALVLVRRRPGSTDLVWVVAYDGEVDADDPRVRAGVVAAMRRLRADIGV
jgi:hypothetical protein